VKCASFANSNVCCKYHVIVIYDVTEQSVETIHSVNANNLGSFIIVDSGQYQKYQITKQIIVTGTRSFL